MTISTNMAGRGTDIQLGGNPEKLAARAAEAGSDEYAAVLERFRRECAAERERVVRAGGLHIIGTGEHESIRIDNQLRGRSGRQGDPGSSIYFISIHDPVYRKFGQKRVIPELKEHLKDHPEGEPVKERRVGVALDGLRKKVEVENQAIRMEVLKYDAVIHDRRESIWRWRRDLLESAGRSEWFTSVNRVLEDLLKRLDEHILETGLIEEGPPPPRNTGRGRGWGSPLKEDEKWQAIVTQISGAAVESASVRSYDEALELLTQSHRDRFGTQLDEALVQFERRILLDIIDRLWPEFLTDLERVDEGIGLRGYGNLDPLVEFRREAALLFGRFIRDVQLHAVRAWLAVDPKAIREARREAASPAFPRVRPKQETTRRKPRAIDKLPKVRPGGRRRRKKR